VGRVESPGVHRIAARSLSALGALAGRSAPTRDGIGTPGSSTLAAGRPDPRRVIGWIIARPQTRTPKAAARLEDLCQVDPVIAQARDLAQRWLGFIRAQTSEGLDAWLKEMPSSGLPAFVAFARSAE